MLLVGPQCRNAERRMMQSSSCEGSDSHCPSPRCAVGSNEVLPPAHAAHLLVVLLPDGRSACCWRCLTVCGECREHRRRDLLQEGLHVGLSTLPPLLPTAAAGSAAGAGLAPCVAAVRGLHICLLRVQGVCAHCL